MKINTTLQKMRRGEPAVGVSLNLGAPVAGEYLSRLGFDFVIVDTQHGLWDDQGSMHAIRNICLGPATPMARVRKNDFGLIGYLLDVGAMGVIVPMVHSAEDAQAAAHAMRYPPRGGRSSGPVGAVFHGADYQSWADDQVFLAVQIESLQAVEQAEQILSVDGVDGCWIGPADLAYSMGVDLNKQQDAQRHKAAVLSVLEACQKTGKIPGIAATPDNIQVYIDLGFRFVTAGGDLWFTVKGGEALLRSLGREPNRVL
jgi:4-hydroxy-2-oxoheptanedioate aldolase